MGLLLMALLKPFPIDMSNFCELLSVGEMDWPLPEKVLPSHPRPWAAVAVVVQQHLGVKNSVH